MDEGTIASLDGLRVDQLKDLLDDANVEYPSNAKKAELIELLEESQ
ncbi:HeH/LEM domain-containing protein [Candidatus Enterococcus testudinis]|nr:HeH/LEM domain-containing protein [Enterococcus sp. 8G7_MSG3316]